MKWYFALNAASIEIDKMYERCVEVAVLSALQHTNLHPHLLFDGQACPFVERLQRMGVTVVFHRTSLSDAIMAAAPTDIAWQRIAHGAFLRIDIPQIDLASEFVVYTDCDVMFQHDTDFGQVRPKLFAVAPEFTPGDYTNMNSGVMVMNLPGLRKVASKLDKFIRAGLPNFPAYDQGALRQFFDGRYEPLPEHFNWKPYWGENPKAEIIHFHGPKPPHAREMLQGKFARHPEVLRDLFNSNRANYAILDVLWHSYAERARNLWSR